MRRLAPLSILLLTACAGGPTPGRPVPPPSTGGTTLPPAVQWVRASAEHRALFLELYAFAGERLSQLAAGRPAGSWAVIMDADETILDNSPYQQELARSGTPFSNATWNAWVRREAATALPGAAAFIKQVEAAGGRVAVVTNRDNAVCPETRENFRRLGITVAVVLCQPTGTAGDKNPRFRAVADGTAAPGLPPLAVVMWVGDNIRDFPDMTQDVRFSAEPALGEFGRSYILLPNPMYGSWSGNAAPPVSGAAPGQTRR